MDKDVLLLHTLRKTKTLETCFVIFIPGNNIECLLVSPVEMTNLRFHAGVTVRVSQQTLDGNKNLGQCEARDPVALLDAVNTNVSVTVHVGMEDLGQEPDLGRSEGVEHGNLEVQVEHTSFIWTSNWTSYSGLPMVVARVQGFGLNTLGGVLCQTFEIMTKSLVSQWT